MKRELKMTTAKKATIKKATAKKATIKKMNVRVNLKKDFSETLEITRTLFKNKVSKTSIVESALCCSAQDHEAQSCTQIALFIIKKLNVTDCFHKRERNKANDILRSTRLRILHHVVNTLVTHHKADKLYRYNKSTDSIEFTDVYQEFCATDKTYRKQVSALLAKIKLQYNATTTTKKKTVTKKATAKKAKKKTVNHVKQSIDMNKLKELVAA